MPSFLLPFLPLWVAHPCSPHLLTRSPSFQSLVSVIQPRRVRSMLCSIQPVLLFRSESERAVRYLHSNSKSNLKGRSQRTCTSTNTGRATMASLGRTLINCSVLNSAVALMSLAFMQTSNWKQSKGMPAMQLHSVPGHVSLLFGKERKGKRLPACPSKGFRPNRTEATECFPALSD